MAGDDRPPGRQHVDELAVAVVDDVEQIELTLARQPAQGAGIIVEAVQQAVGTPKKNVASFAFLREFVEEAKRSGIVASLIERHGVTGRLSVAPPA